MKHRAFKEQAVKDGALWCPECNGEGMVFDERSFSSCNISRVCDECGGEGIVAAPEPEDNCAYRSIRKPPFEGGESAEA